MTITIVTRIIRMRRLAIFQYPKSQRQAIILLHFTLKGSTF